MVKMFGDDTWAEELAEEILLSFPLDEVLEMNDLTELETLVHLIEAGLISEPERIVRKELD